MTFSIYDVPAGGSPVWTDTILGVTVVNGIFTVTLGTVANPISASVLGSADSYIGVAVGADAEMTPRQKLSSAPYALKAAEADAATTLAANVCASGETLVKSGANWICSAAAGGASCFDGDGVICYSGAPGTAGVGQCTSGVRTCSANAYGACVGEVTPSAEVCDGLDNDCNMLVDDNCIAIWTCDPAFYGALDGVCDCGCGLFDPDCADQTVGSCSTCAIQGSCAGANGCAAIEPLNNAVCVAPLQCAPNEIICNNAVCADLSADPNNCGACGRGCGGGICVSGQCQCLIGQITCPGNVCADLASDPNNCGACGSPVVDDGNPCTAEVCVSGLGTHSPEPDGTSCGVGGSCQGGTCTCPVGQVACPGNVCADLASDPNNCGACGSPVIDDGNPCTAEVCVSGVSTYGGPVPDGTWCGQGLQCIAGTCSCPIAGQTYCGQWGCVDLASDLNNCGACYSPVIDDGNPCTAEVCISGVSTYGGPAQDGTSCGQGMQCIAGMCSCSIAGQVNCGQLGCVDISSDPNSCGGCGVPVVSDGNPCTAEVCISGVGTSTPMQDGTLCGVGGTCQGGWCTCPAGQVTCPSGCADLASDPNNCGTCGLSVDDGNPCTADQCVSGVISNLAGQLQQGMPCGGGRLCESGVCTCAIGQAYCAMQGCVDLVTDPNNCGGCGISVDDGAPCTDDVCLTGVSYHSTYPDGTVCGLGKVCTAGACL